MNFMSKNAHLSKSCKRSKISVKVVPMTSYTKSQIDANAFTIIFITVGLFERVRRLVACVLTEESSSNEEKNSSNACNSSMKHFRT